MNGDIIINIIIIIIIIIIIWFVPRVSSEIIGFGIRGTDFKLNARHLETHVRLGLDHISSGIITINIIIIIIIIAIIDNNNNNHNNHINNNIYY